ncbi:MAG: phasin [Alphaproteobacteria bacterium]|nr:MAG: phasin [Alphaproteobacteria bacterium]
MTEPHLDVPADIRELVDKTIDQTEKAFSFFFNAANASMVSDAAKTVLSVAQQNVKAAFDHARKLANAQDLQETMALQAEFLRTQIEIAGEFMRSLPSERPQK